MMERTMNDRWQTLMAVDFDKWAAATYAANFPAVDVRCATVADTMDDLPAADVLIGGPPCQSFSRAGKGEGGAGKVNAWPEAIEAVRRLRPRQFLFENVPGMLDEKHLAYAVQVYAELESLGYRMIHAELDAVDYGVPQFRNRLWFWGIRGDVDAVHRWPTPTHVWPWPSVPSMFGCDLIPAVTVGQALGLTQKRSLTQKCIDNTYSPFYASDQPARTQDGSPHGVIPYRWSDAMLAKHPPASPAPSVQAKWFKGGAEGLVEAYDHGTASADEPCCTIKGGGNIDRRGHLSGGCPPALTIDTKQHRTERGVNEPAAAAAADDRRHIKADGVYVRRLTPLECARLQSCPDDMAWPDGISKTAMYRVIGNGWACGIAARLSESLAEADPQSHTVVDLFCGGGLGSLGWHGRYWSYTPPDARQQETTR